MENFYKAYPEIFSLPSQEHEDYRMISYLFFELSKGTSSQWHTYFKFLPKDPETVTDWKEREILELQDSDFARDILTRQNWNANICKDLEKVYKEHPELFSKEITTLACISWLWKILTTRCFGGGLPYHSLIPVADLFNHSNGPTNYFYGIEEDFSSDVLDLVDEDADDNLIDETDCIRVSCKKLHKINFFLYETTPEIAEISKEVECIARKLDAEDIMNSKKY